MPTDLSFYDRASRALENRHVEWALEQYGIIKPMRGKEIGRLASVVIEDKVRELKFFDALPIWRSLEEELLLVGEDGDDTLTYPIVDGILSRYLNPSISYSRQYICLSLFMRYVWFNLDYYIEKYPELYYG